MNGNQSTNSSAPLFYIIQPKIKIKQTEQNMQEIFHGRPKPKVSVEAPKEETKERKVDDGIQPEVDAGYSKMKDDSINLNQTVQEEATITISLEKIQTQIDKEVVSSSDKEKENTEMSLEINSSGTRKADIEELAINIEDENLNLNSVGEIDIPLSITNLDIDDITETPVQSFAGMEMDRKELRTKLIRLARYPAVVPRPLCELTLRNEVLTGTILSKRGEQLKVRIGEITRFLSIDEIEEVNVI